MHKEVHYIHHGDSDDEDHSDSDYDHLKRLGDFYHPDYDHSDDDHSDHDDYPRELFYQY